MLRGWWWSWKRVLHSNTMFMEIILLVLKLGDPMSRYSTGERKYFNFSPLGPKLCEFTASRTSRRCLCPEHDVMQLLSESQNPSAQGWHGAAQKIWQLLNILRLKACWEHSKWTSFHVNSQRRAPAQVTFCSSGLFCPPLQHWALTVKSAPWFSLCQQSLDDFSTCFWLTSCNRKFSLTPFSTCQLPPSSERRGSGGFVYLLKLCKAAAHQSSAQGCKIWMCSESEGSVEWDFGNLSVAHAEC